MKKFIVTFPGQGSQSVGMMSNLSNSTIIKKTFDEASEIIGIDFWSMINEDNNDINQTINTQPLMLTAGIATWRHIQSNKILNPAYAAGHSLGEITALVAADSLDFSVGLNLVRKRAELMQNAVPKNEGGMAAILGLSDKKVVEICQSNQKDGVLEAVNFNSPGQVVIAGNKKILESSLKNFKAGGAKRALLLPVSVPSHCKLMEPAAKDFRSYLINIRIKMPNFPVIQNYEALAYNSTKEIKEALVLQLYNPVRWTDTIKYLSSQNIDVFIESGPGKILTGLNRRINKGISHIAIDSNEETAQFLTAISA
jgi:[acyl-carrier-protein] S-malonyltransferase